MHPEKMDTDFGFSPISIKEEMPTYTEHRARRPPPQLTRLRKYTEVQHQESDPLFIGPHPLPLPLPSQGDQFVTSTVNNSIPALEEWAGPLQFKVDVRLPKLSGRMLQAAFDPETRKLYVDCFMSVPFGFRVKKGVDTSELRLRALPVYSEMHHVNTPVRRCPSHREASHETNIDAKDHIEWVVRADNCNAKYEASGATGERRSVVVPFEAPQPGTGEFLVLYKFCCMNTCVGGINRRRLRVLFTLENIVTEETIGRGSVELKVCRCPVRDFRTDMQRRNRSSQQQRPSKRAREPSPGRPRPETFLLDCGSEAVYKYMKTVLDALHSSLPDMSAEVNPHRRRQLSRSPVSSPQDGEVEESCDSSEANMHHYRRPSISDIRLKYL